MNTSKFLLAMLGCLVFSLNKSKVEAQESGLPPVPTAEELATPPSGEIRKLYLRDVNDARTAIQTTIAQVPADQQSAAIFITVQSVKNGLDALMTTRSQSDLFNIIPLMAQVFESHREDGSPSFVHEVRNSLENITMILFKVMAAHIKEKQGNVELDPLGKFVTAFSIRGIFLERDWEDEPPPVGAADIFILNADAVLTLLKTRPVEQAQRFTGGATTAQFFARYQNASGGMQVLKAKYAQNKQAIEGKYTELVNWVAQHQQNP